MGSTENPARAPQNCFGHFVLEGVNKSGATCYSILYKFLKYHFGKHFGQLLAAENVFLVKLLPKNIF